MLAPCGGVMALRRDVYLKVGGEDEDFVVYYEDLDLGWRLWVMGYKVVMAPRAVSYHWHSAFYRTVPDARTRVLYERNALLSVIKNYDDDNLRRVLPAALFLMLKRAYLFSGVDPADYHIEPTAIGGQPAEKSLLYYVREGWHIARQRGLADLLHNVRAEVRRRCADPAYDRWLRRRRARLQGSYEEVPQQTVSPLLAAADVLALLPVMMEKRRFIQSRRRRPDAEIFPLFKLPLEVSYADREYESTQQELVRIFELDTLFQRDKQYER